MTTPILNAASFNSTATNRQDIAHSILAGYHRANGDNVKRDHLIQCKGEANAQLKQSGVDKTSVELAIIICRLPAHVLQQLTSGQVSDKDCKEALKIANAARVLLKAGIEIDLQKLEASQTQNKHA